MINKTIFIMNNNDIESYIKDLDKTFANGSNSNIIEVENFIEKYRILIYNVTNTYIEKIDMTKCIDFTTRIQKCFDASEVTKYRILTYIE